MFRFLGLAVMVIAALTIGIILLGSGHSVASGF